MFYFLVVICCLKSSFVLALMSIGYNYRHIFFETENRHKREVIKND